MKSTSTHCKTYFGKILKLLLAFLCFWPNLATSASLPSYALDDSQTILQDFPIHLISDTQHKLTIEDIGAQSIPLNLQTGRISTKTLSTIWTGFHLYNASNTPQNRLIGFDESFLYSANLYCRAPEQTHWQKYQNGIRIPMNERQVYSDWPVFNITLEPNAQLDCYLMSYSASSEASYGIFIMPTADFINLQRTQQLLYAAFIGALFALTIYNLFLFISLRDKLYFYYVGHGAFFLLFLFAISGFDLLLGLSANWHYNLFAIAALGTAFSVLFSQNLLNLAQHFPRLNKLLYGLVGAFTLLSILALYDFSNYAYVILLTAPTMLLLLATGIWAFIKRIAMAKFYLFGISWYLLGIMLLAAHSANLIPHHPIFRHGFLMGALAEMLIFSLALAYRVRLLKNETLKFQEQYQQQLASEQTRLENQVAQRTDELNKLNLELLNLSNIDGLTGLYNRRYFDVALAREWSRAARVNSAISLLMCDIDYFKKYNDSMGHQKGDDCLMQVAKLCQTTCQRETDIVARYGGEEIAIILPGAPAEQALIIAQALQDKVAQAAISHRQSPLSHITLSIGIATLYPKPTNKATQLILLADKALYESKDAGRNKISVAQTDAS